MSLWLWRDPVASDEHKIEREPSTEVVFRAHIGVEDEQTPVIIPLVHRSPLPTALFLIIRPPNPRNRFKAANSQWPINARDMLYAKLRSEKCISDKNELCQ